MSENNESTLWGQWAKGVYDELTSIRKEQNEQFKELRNLTYSNKEAVNEKITTFQREFIEFKTKINTRTAVISAVFSVIVSGSALIYTLIQISNKL